MRRGMWRGYTGYVEGVCGGVHGGGTWRGYMEGYTEGVHRGVRGGGMRRGMQLPLATIDLVGDNREFEV